MKSVKVVINNIVSEEKEQELWLIDYTEGELQQCLDDMYKNYSEQYFEVNVIYDTIM